MLTFEIFAHLYSMLARPKIEKLLFDYASNLDLCVRDNEGYTVFESVLEDKDFEIMKMIAFHNIIQTKTLNIPN